MKNTFKRILYCFTILLFLFISYIGLSIYYYKGSTSNTKADAAIVLGAAIWGDKPSPVFRERINHAIRLYKADQITKIIFTGGKNIGDKYAEAYVAKIYAMKNGVAKSDIYLEIESRTTEENIYYAKQIAEENGLNTFFLVSDPLHMKRAMLMAEDHGLNAYPSPTTTTRYKSWRSKMQFLLREIFFYSVYLIRRLF